MINKDKIHELIEVYYHPVFKTFYINSLDGKTFTKKPIGVFVSLGLTTSKKVLEDIKQKILNHHSKDNYEVTLAEISSKKKKDQFLNKVIENSKLEPYEIYKIPNNVLSEEKSRLELSELKKELNKNQENDLLKYKITKLEHLIDKISQKNEWNIYMIQKEAEDYKMYHKYVNYKKDKDLEFRLGILIKEKTN